jgi:hypothetical protein
MIDVLAEPPLLSVVRLEGFDPQGVQGIAETVSRITARDCRTPAGFVQDLAAVVRPRSGHIDDDELIVAGPDRVSESFSVRADPDADISLRKPFNWFGAQADVATDAVWRNEVGPVADSSAVRVIVRFPAAGHPTIDTIGVELAAPTGNRDGLGARLVNLLKTWFIGRPASMPLGVSLVDLRKTLNAHFKGYGGINFYLRHNAKTVRVSELFVIRTSDGVG